MQVATELDLLSVAVRNVIRAQARIPEQHRPEMGGQDVLELMRNVSALGRGRWALGQCAG